MPEPSLRCTLFLYFRAHAYAIECWLYFWGLHCRSLFWSPSILAEVGLDTWQAETLATRAHG